jgi:signal transduction histidine kinase
MRAVATIRAFALPLQAAIALGCAVADATPWRRGALLGAAALALAGVAFDAVTAPGATRARWPLPVLVGAVLTQAVIFFCTGALESPLMPIALPMAAALGFVVQRPAEVAIAVGAQLATVGGCLACELAGWPSDLVPGLLGGGARAGHRDVHLGLAAAVLALAVVVLAFLGRRLRLVVDDMVRRAFTAQSAALALYRDQARTLRALSAEMAHELKNPLASVKGLGALLARDVSEGRASERLGVLRKEVDRMQQIVDELLTFSRPFVPLSEEEVDLAALVREVGTLHDGLAAQRGLCFEIVGCDEGTAVGARCDPRKVKQVLVNVVQNAIEATPPGGTVRLVLERSLAGRAGEVAIRVLDQGGGIDEALRPRLFEPGATSKEGGSGLGLVIARSLARQHGGELTLETRAEGGAEARLTLPVTAVPLLTSIGGRLDPAPAREGEPR